MKKLLFAIATLALCFATMPAAAQQAPVNIVYPIDGGTYPITGPAPGPLGAAYFTSSFSVTCDGDHTVKWGFDNTQVGSATFYDQISVQFVHKQSGGNHSFWVDSDCGTAKVNFDIGN